MAFIPETNLPGTHTSGISDNTLSATALGAVGGIGLGACLGLAPTNVFGVALVAGALLGSSSSRR